MAMLELDVGAAYGWAQRAPHCDATEGPLATASMERRLAGLLEPMTGHQASPGILALPVAHFPAVMPKYWAGLFYRESVADLLSTSNDLAPFLGVRRGSAQLVACAVTRLRPCAGEKLAPDTARSRQEPRQALKPAASSALSIVASARRSSYLWQAFATPLRSKTSPPFAPLEALTILGTSRKRRTSMALTCLPIISCTVRTCHSERCRLDR
jgi:hypothetical protein